MLAAIAAPAAAVSGLVSPCASYDLSQFTIGDVDAESWKAYLNEALKDAEEFAFTINYGEPERQPQWSKIFNLDQIIRDGRGGSR